MIIKEYQEDYKKEINKSNNINELKDRKYMIKEIDQINDNNYYQGSSISKNKQYLAYGAYNTKLLKIYDIKLQKIIKELQLDNFLYVCQFTQDSSQLYVGLEGGYVYGYDVNDDFKEIYKQQIHSSSVDNIITIKNKYLITCSADPSIIKTDIKNKKQIFKLIGHTDFIMAIDYNDKDEIIVSGSDDKSIKLWNCRNQGIIINKEQAHKFQIRQIQLINNNSNILSLDCDGNLYKWKIDSIQKDLNKLEVFTDQNKIFNFYQVNQDKNLLLICNNYVKILNQQGETLNTIDHGGQSNILILLSQIYHLIIIGLLYSNYDCRQLDNMKYIQIRCQDRMILVMAQD